MREKTIHNRVKAVKALGKRYGVRAFMSVKLNPDDLRNLSPKERKRLGEEFAEIVKRGDVKESMDNVEWKHASLEEKVTRFEKDTNFMTEVLVYLTIPFLGTAVAFDIALGGLGIKAFYLLPAVSSFMALGNMLAWHKVKYMINKHKPNLREALRKASDSLDVSMWFSMVGGLTGTLVTIISDPGLATPLLTITWAGVFVSGIMKGLVSFGLRRILRATKESTSQEQDLRD